MLLVLLNGYMHIVIIASLSSRLAKINSLTQSAPRLLPGFLVCAIAGLAAQFLADHYGAPAMLMALLIGMSFHFMGEEGPTIPGIAFTSRTVLRIGVALLGVRMSAELLVGIGPATIGLIIAAITATILFGLAGAKLLNRGWRLALLTGGSVAICGASAAMAIAAVLPRGEQSERNLVFTIIGVTVLSTMAMIIYPIIVSAFGMDDRSAGIFIGATVHDVAQVVGAGFSISEEAGETATLVKLVRVTLLAPVVLVFSLAVRNLAPVEAGARRPPLVPTFVLGFVALAIINSVGLIPAALASILVDLSRWGLLFGITAVGMKTSLKSIREVGSTAIILIVAETIFIALFVISGMRIIG